MAKDPAISLNVHVNDETKIEAVRVPSERDDFVALKLGWQISVLLMNPAQAKALAIAAQDAYSILKQVQIEKERAEMLRSWDEDDVCTDDDPCSSCRRFQDEDRGYDYEPF